MGLCVWGSSALIAGYTREQMIWYVMITEMIWFGARSEVVIRQVSADIRGENIAHLMNKPYHYTLYILARHTGEWCIRIPMYMVFAVAVFYRGLRRYTSGNLMGQEFRLKNQPGG